MNAFDLRAYLSSLLAGLALALLLAVTIPSSVHAASPLWTTGTHTLSQCATSGFQVFALSDQRDDEFASCLVGPATPQPAPIAFACLTATPTPPAPFSAGLFLAGPCNERAPPVSLQA